MIDPTLARGLLLSSIALCACGGGTESPEDPDLHRLRGLPYVGSTPIAPNEGAGVVLHDETRSWPGYTLYTVQMLARAELIDASGTVRRSWRQRDSDRWERAELLPGGDLLAIGVDRTGQPRGIPDDARYLARYDWNGRLLWKRTLTAHHDVEAAADGTLTLLTFRRRRIASIHAEIDVREDLIERLDPDGDPREALSLLEAYARAPDVLPLLGKGPDRMGVEPWVDLFHANSVEWVGPAEVLVSLRHQDAIVSIDWPGRRLRWGWGHGELSGPHDARSLDNGNVLVFDNGVSRGWSRVVEVDPATGRIVWQYRASPPESFFTLSKGSSQRLPNGNTLIAESDRGHVFEVTRAGDIVWEFFCPHEVEPGRRAAIVRAVRHDVSAIDSLLRAVEP